MLRLTIAIVFLLALQYAAAFPFAQANPKGVLRIKEASTDREFTESETIELTCEAMGSPPPTIRWLRNYEMLNETTPGLFEDITNSYEQRLAANLDSVYMNLGTTGSRLLIPCASRADAAIYTCVAQTPNKMETVDIRVTVRPSVSDKRRVTCSSVIGSESVEPAMEPVVFMWSEGRTATVGFPVQLYCRAYGYPQPRVIWSTPDVGWLESNEDAAEKGGNYQILPSGDLLIKELKKDYHRESFKCRAENDYGYDEVGKTVYGLSFSNNLRALR